MSRRLVLLIAIVLGSLAPNLQADDIAALPGANSLGSNITVLDVKQLTTAGSFTAGNSAFLILQKPDGTKNYVIAKSGTGSVTVVDNNFANPKSIASFATAATGAAISPDGSRLVVAAATVHIFETTKDQDLVPGGINTGVSVFDVAISLDGSRAYVLGLSGSGGSQVNAIDLASNTIVGSAQYGILGTATAITVGLNGRVYVSTQNQIVELDPATLQPTTGGIMGVNARPGKVVFTPDGKYGLAVNQTPITGSAILVIDLNAHSVINFVPNLNVVFDTLLVANSTTVFAYSSQTEGLYQVGIGTGGSVSIAGASIGGAPTTFVNGVAISNEVQFAGRTIAQYLFVASSNILYRIDLTVGQLTAQTSLPNQQFTALEYLAPASTVGPVSSTSVLLQYGDKQNVAPNAKSLPLVVRALDLNGKPLSGVVITFSTNSSTASVSPTSATTGADGFAETILTAPATNGTVTVTATDGNKHTVGFTINVGSGTVQNAGTAVIVAGQGQLLGENINSSIPGFGSLLTVLITDLNGKPVSGAKVIFTITSGSATLFGGAAFANGVTINTNAQGLASAAILTSVVPPGLGFTQASITAKAAGTNTVTFYETTYPTNTAFTPLVQFLSPQSGATLTGGAGTVISGAFTAIVVSAQGFAIPNVSVRACSPQPPPGGGLAATCTVPAAGTLVPFGSCVDPSGQGVLSDAHGKVSCDLQLNGVEGSGVIGAEFGYHFDTKPFPLKITAGPPGTINLVQGNSQTGKPGQQLPVALVVQVSDSFGNVLPFTPVSWSVLGTGVPATLNNPSSATDANGLASTLVTLGNTVGTAIIQVTAGNVSNSFSLTIVNPAAGIQPVSGNTQTAIVGTAFGASLVVKVVDNQGNGVAGATVTFTLSSGNASIGTPSASTDTTGQASTLVTAGSTPGSIVIVAASGSFSTTFTLTSRLRGPQNIVFLNGASFHIQHGCQPLGCVAPGEIVTIQGSGFADGVQGVQSGLTILGPLPTSLAGITITFNGVAAPIFYVANVNGVQSMTFQVPFETQVGTATVVLSVASGGSLTIPGGVPVQPYAPGVFTSTYGNQVVAVAVRSDGSYISPTNPAHPGETIYVFVTGLGQVNPAAGTNQAGSGQAVTASVVVGLNNKGVPHTTVVYAPGLVGVYTIGVQIPLTTQTGPHQPFGLILNDSAGNLYFAEGTFIPIQ
jgi:uncharacterized protein (TIGR03437 family)